MPFGRFVGSSEVGPPADEVLVGRERERAYLIDLLISTGRRGAYLVTGRRGTGKTSFVKHCVAEYEASVFSRFLRANVGRGFWDRALVLVLWLAILTGVLVLSELAQLLVPLARSGARHSLLLWVVLAPIGVVLLYPCVYAKVVVEAIIHQWSARRKAFAGQLDIASSESQIPGVSATLLVLLLAGAIWLVPVFGSPVVGVALFIPLVGGLYFVAQAVSFEHRSPPRFKWLLVYGALAVFTELNMTTVVLAFWSARAPQSIMLLSFALGSCFLGLGLLLRGFYQRSRVIDRQPLTRALLSVHALLWEAVGAGYSWYLAGGSALCLLAAGLFLLVPANLTEPFQGRDAWIPWALATGTAALFVYPFATGCIPRRVASIPACEACKFRPRPPWLLAAKAGLWIVVALQLAHPVLALANHALVGNIPWCSPTAAPGVSGPLALCDLLGFGPERPASLFSQRALEWPWLLTLLILVAVFYFLEYEWIIRSYLRPREDRAIDAGDQAPWDDWDDEQRQPGGTGPLRGLSEYDHERFHRAFAELTLPWIVYKTWLPVLPVAVNLGFDRLGHRQVIQAMLVGLRERYYRTFLAWNCWLANLGRFVGFLVLLTLVTLAGGTWFHVKLSTATLSPLPASSVDRPSVCKEFQGRAGGIASLACRAGEIWYQILYFDFVPERVKMAGDRSGEPGNLLLFELLPHAEAEAPAGYDIPRGVHFCVYHVLLFGLFFFSGKWLLRKVPVLPYKENLRRIDDLLDSLSARTKVTFTSSLWGPARWVHSVFSDERLRETERDPVDPRTVELAFLQILEDIQKGGFRFPGAARHHLTMPAPEITFMFDELDKLGTRVDPEASALEPSAQQQEMRTLFDERERSIKLRALLSDLKNILASAPARFIFVGGRDLHDEWLADQTARQPLLTSIFSSEVYLPSLMVDHTVSGRCTLDHRTAEYVVHQYRRAAILHLRAARKRQRPSFALSAEVLVHERYLFGKEELSLPALVDREANAELGPEGKALIDDFIRYLTHRSIGNAKKLKDLLASFIRPAGRELERELRWQRAPCRHVLRFDDIDIFRIQLLVTIYRHLGLAFEERMLARDDKMAISIFFLTDFLFKFHRRAFSWGNLERVDDLAHIHRLPDLRDIQEELVDHFSERFLHRVLNGMYAFRFRSDVAREVEYLSRRSSVEMAAFNFTLDESQSLKASYLAAMEKEKDNPDLVAGLGELYEFDQEFERARHCYRQAIELLDKHLLVKLNRPFIEKPSPEDFGATVRAIMAGDDAGLENLRIFLPWGEARLRLMLQIGMTFEQARSLERAAVEYRAARTLARALVTACTSGPDPKQGTADELRLLLASLLHDTNNTDRDRGQGGRFHTLKHLPIVFQPVFAEAWASEKIVGTIDTSVSLLEHSLWEIRSSLPFVNAARLEPAPDPTKPVHANFGLTMSQLHNKLGDLYFFKGRQPVGIEHILAGLAKAEQATDEDRVTDGYLLRAHYHYAVALHELRRYLYQRVGSSKDRYSIARQRSPTFRRDVLPDFMLRAAATSINDMAEATLARVAPFELFADIHTGVSEEVDKLMSYDLAELCSSWLGSADRETPAQLANWFGVWTSAERFHSEQPLITFVSPDTAAERLLMSVKLCLVGAGYFEKGGYPEDAARELLQVCDTVARHLWWARVVEAVGANWPQLIGKDESLAKQLRKLSMEKILEGAESREYWSYLIELAVGALERADRLFAQSRHHDGDREPVESYRLGDEVPAEALTLLCSLALASRADLLTGREERLRRLIRRWIGDDAAASYRSLLETSLLRHRYPMINRLNGLKVLIDHQVLTDPQMPLEAFDACFEWTAEMLDLAQQFDAPFHFTPLHSGITCTALYLRWVLEGLPGQQNVDGKRQSRIERVLHAAQRDLRLTEEMYTMRRSYYEAISDLYYLYDDFNDRQIHLNHALQMAGAELTCILRSLIDVVPKKPAQSKQLLLPFTELPGPEIAAPPQHPQQEPPDGHLWQLEQPEIPPPGLDGEAGGDQAGGNGGGPEPAGA